MREPESETLQVDEDKMHQDNKLYKLPKDVIVVYAKWLEANDYSRSTSRSYCLMVKKLIGVERKIGINKIKNNLKSEKQKSTLRYAAIRKFIAFLDDRYHVNFPYFIYPRFRAQQKIKEPAPSRDDVKKIILGLEERSKESFCLWDYRLIIEFIFRMGCRVSEAINLRVANVDWKEWLKDTEQWGKLALLKTKGKKSRMLPVAPSLMKKLYNSIMETDKKIYDKDAFVFDYGFERYRHLTYKRWKKKRLRLVKGDPRSEETLMLSYIKKCENDIAVRIKEVSQKVLGRKVKTHSLRAAKATDLDNNGVPISKIRDYLGHKDISTTSIYLRGTYEELEDNIKKVDDF